MKFDLFNNLKVKRENYVKEFRVVDEIKIEPCGKFVACLNKLSCNYVLALVDGVETMQVANTNDIEFYEGYEISSSYTDSVRKRLCQLTRDSYFKLFELSNCVNALLDIYYDINNGVSDIKIDINVISRVVLNIYKHLTMTDDVPVVKEKFETFKDKNKLLIYIKNLILDILKALNEISLSTIISYIEKAINNIMDTLLIYYNKF